jgi:hypothetical protein
LVESVMPRWSLGQPSDAVAKPSAWEHSPLGLTAA